MRSLRVLLGALLCTTAVVATACGGGNGGETTATYDEGCTESHPYGVDGQGVLQACSSGALSLAVTNTSSSVVEVSLVDPGLLASATFQPAQGNSASVVLPGQLVDGGCGTTSCTLLPGDGAVLVKIGRAHV